MISRQQAIDQAEGVLRALTSTYGQPEDRRIGIEIAQAWMDLAKLIPDPSAPTEQRPCPLESAQLSSGFIRMAAELATSQDPKA